MTQSDRRHVNLAGWMTVNVAEGLRSLIEQTGAKTALEVGTFCGLSTTLLALNLDHVTTVDTFRGGEERYLEEAFARHGITDQRATVEGNLQAFGVRNRVEIIEAASDEAAVLLAGRTFDLVYLDASHIEEQVARDIEHFLPMAKLVICGDDYSPQWPSVRAAVDRMLPDADTSSRLWRQVLR